MTFSEALDGMKRGERWRREAYKPNKFMCIVPANEEHMSFLAIKYLDGRLAPWTPTRCDLLEDDWRRA